MRHIAIASIFVAALVAGEAQQPLIRLTMPDLVRTSERLASGPYGKIWRLPAMQKLRADATAKVQPDQRWTLLFDRALEARSEMTLALASAESQPPTVRMAWRMPEGQDPPAPPDGFVRRQGEWFLYSNTEGLALPQAANGEADADLRAHFNCDALVATVPAAEAEKFRNVLAIWGLGRVDMVATAYPGGTRERVIAYGAKLPLREIDLSALAGWPERPMAIMVIGIDGKALINSVREVARVAGTTAGLGRDDQALRAKIAGGVDDLLMSFDGTLVFAVTSGVPFPGATVSLPANAMLDNVVASLIEELAPGTGTQTVAQARTQSVLVPLPKDVPVALSIRRTANRWILSTDAILVEALAADKPSAFPVQKLWPTSAGAVGLGWGDTKAQTQLIVGLVPMAVAAMQGKEQQRILVSVQTALAATLPHLLPSSLVARVGKEGLRIDGENCLISHVVPLSVVAGMAFPAISMVRENARRAQAGNNMRQLTLCMLAYCNDNDGHWPRDLAEVKTFAAGELPDTLFQSPGHPDIAQPFCYVRPVVLAGENQPILVQDPVCNRGKGCQVSYGDGHIEYLSGPRALALWAEAKRLAGLPKAMVNEGGIEMSDWTTLQAVAPVPTP